jgi:hypothetical protein
MGDELALRLWYVSLGTKRSRNAEPLLFASRQGSPNSVQKGILKSTNVLMELAMINWPEMLTQVEDWAAGFWVGTATASLVGIIVAAAALLTHVI